MGDRWELDTIRAELNRLMGLNLPEDAGYDTLGGFVSTTLGRIPEKDETFEAHGAKFTVLDAEPIGQRIHRGTRGEPVLARRRRVERVSRNRRRIVLLPC